MLLEGVGLLVSHCLLCIISFALPVARQGSPLTALPGEHLAVLTGWFFCCFNEVEELDVSTRTGRHLGPKIG